MSDKRQKLIKIVLKGSTNTKQNKLLEINGKNYNIEDVILIYVRRKDMYMIKIFDGICFRTLITTISAIGVAYYIPSLTDKIVKYKESKRSEGLEEYNIETDVKITRYFNYILLISVFLVQMSLYQGFELLILMLVSTLAILAMRVDQQVRIIPNEIVFVILGLSFIRQSYVNDLSGLIGSVIAMLAVAMMFYITSNISSVYFGRVGVGAGDVKLTISMSAMFGSQGVLIFMMCIAAALMIYIVYGFTFKKYTLKTTFPMGQQITYGFLLAIIVIKIM